MFNPGIYYVGDLVCVFSEDDLRGLFAELLTCGSVRNGSGLRELLISRNFNSEGFKCDQYWISKTPNKSGTLYDQTNKSWGFEWGIFGCMLFKYFCGEGNFDRNKVVFEQPFNCELKDNGTIRIGHLVFSTNLNDK